MTDDAMRRPAEVGVHDAIAERIARHGSIRFDEFMELALYDPAHGFFATGGGAGRGGADFLTSPEVGPLFGAVVGEYLDRRWEAMGCPDPFVVVEAAAGRGALALALIGASPRCRTALRYVLVERSEELRRRQGEHLALVHPFEVLAPTSDPDDGGRPAMGRGSGPAVCSLAELPAEAFEGVVIANELLDNVAVRLLERRAEGWGEVRVTGGGAQLAELVVPADDHLSALAESLAPDAPLGARIPVQGGAVDWLRRSLGLLRAGSVLVIDYASTTPELAVRPQWDWFRTYRHHERGQGPLWAPGHQDLTCEVTADQLAAAAAPTTRTTQAEWLRTLGIDELVEEGRRIWTEHAAAPDLAAMRARSRVAEAEALLDPRGLGGFDVLEWVKR